MNELSPRALQNDSTGPGDRARFFRVERHGALDCLTATFRTHVFPPHTHETYVIGVVEDGVHSYMHSGKRIVSGPGDICFINPGEVHDGTPLDGGYSYRMIYPFPSLLAKVASEVAGRPVGAPRFALSGVNDPELASRFIMLHRSMERGHDPLLTDELLYRLLGVLCQRYGREGLAVAQLGRERTAVRIAKDYLDARLADTVDLETVSREAGLTPFHLIRVFRRETGLTPHAWVVDRRIQVAAQLLRRGIAPSEVALDCGFADQSHLTRAFKARLGVTPGRFRRPEGLAA